MSPFFIGIDADLDISQRGEVSAALTALHDVPTTNLLILQPRIDLKLQAQRVPDLSLGAGFTDVELVAPLRYEITCSVTPYYRRGLGPQSRRTAVLRGLMARATAACLSRAAFA